MYFSFILKKITGRKTNKKLVISHTHAWPPSSIVKCGIGGRRRYRPTPFLYPSLSLVQINRLTLSNQSWDIIHEHSHRHDRNWNLNGWIAATGWSEVMTWTLSLILDRDRVTLDSPTDN